jgi:iron complex outermembrane receptor protein
MRQLKHLRIYLSVVAATMSYHAHAQQSIAQGVSSLSVDEIIVTARKTEESIQDVPLSIQAVSSEDIAQRDLRGMEDIVRGTPGVTFESFSQGGASTSLVVRGLTNTFTNTRVQNVSVFLNGIYLQRQGMINPGLLDMQRVEVLKGPQSTLFGRNAFAGAVNYITAEPSDVFGGKVSVTVGDNMRRDYKGSITGSLVEDLVYGKFSYITSTYDGHTKNSHVSAGADPSGFNTKHNLGGWDNESFSTGLRFVPRDDLTIGLDWYHTDLATENAPFYVIRGAGYGNYGLNAATPTVNGQYANIGTNCNSTSLDANVTQGKTVAGTGNTLWCGSLPHRNPQTNSIVVDPRSNGTSAKTDIVSFNVDWEFSDSWLMSYQYGYAHHTTETNSGQSGYGDAWFNVSSNAFVRSPLETTGWNGNPNATLKSDSHELRFEWEGNDLLSASFGAYYSKVQDADYYMYMFSSVCGPGYPSSNCLSPVNENSTTILPADGGGYLNSYQSGKKSAYTRYEDEVYSVFGTLTFNLADDLRLRLEGRYTEEAKAAEFVTDTFGLKDGESFSAYVNQFAGVLTVADKIAEPHVSDRFYFFAPRAALEWNVTADNMLFFTVAKGEKTGGFNNTPDPSQVVYDAENNWTYEIGSKNTFLDNSVILNASLYYVDWKDIQGPVTASSSASSSGYTVNPIANIGSGDNVGFEVDGMWNITSNWSIDGGVSFSDPKFKDTIYVDAIQESGNWHCDGSVCDADGSVDGNQLQRTSKKQAFWGITYKTIVLDGWGLSARLDGSYQSRQYVDPLNTAYVPSRTLYNANVTLQAPNNWEFTLWGKNIFDKDYASGAFSIAQFNQYVVSLGAGESYGVTATYSFE